MFLEPAGRCRSHAKFGPEAKPLACRLYPLVLHPAGKKLVAGLRFSCPSAVANRGKPLSEQGAELQKLATWFVPAGHQESPPPPVAAGSLGEWPDFLRFVKWLDATLADEGVSVALKLVRAVHWLNAVEQGGFDRITGSGADEILEALSRSAAQKLPALPPISEEPSRFGRFFLRMTVLEHARTTTVRDLDSLGQHRWRMLWASLRFALASTRPPALRSGMERERAAQQQGQVRPA